MDQIVARNSVLGEKYWLDSHIHFIPMMQNRSRMGDQRHSPEQTAADEVGAVLLSEDEIASIVRSLGWQITNDYAGRAPLLVGVLKGAVVFLSDLLRSIDLPTEIDFLAVSSYGTSTTASGVVRILKDLDVSLVGRDVILVEDIIDSGLTLSFLLDIFERREPASLAVCALLVREGLELPEKTKKYLRYTGHSLQPGWVVGYGLDAGGRNRHLRALHRFVAPADRS